jgi:hypothetical protein
VVNWRCNVLVDSCVVVAKFIQQAVLHSWYGQMRPMFDTQNQYPHSALQQEKVMKDGRCPKCHSSAVRMRRDALYAKNPGLRPDAQLVVGTALLTESAELTTYVCTACGCVESYITDQKKLRVIAEKWDAVE